MILDWLVSYKSCIQWGTLFVIVSAAILQFLSNYLNQRANEIGKKEIHESIREMGKNLEKLSSVDGLDRYLQPIKIEALKKYLAEKDLEELQILLKEFSQFMKDKEEKELKQVIYKILKIIPTDPYFRVYSYLCENDLIKDVFSEKRRLVQIIRWDWKVVGDEKVNLFVETTESVKDKPVSYGPLTNNSMSVLNGRLKQLVRIKIEGSGTGQFEFYPRSVQFGWAVAEKNETGVWVPNKNLAEYDPFFRINMNNQLVV